VLRAALAEQKGKKAKRAKRWAMLTAVENGGAGRSKMVALGGVDLP
jgi:hypothetical protein